MLITAKEVSRKYNINYERVLTLAKNKQIPVAVEGKPLLFSPVALERHFNTEQEPEIKPVLSNPTKRRGRPPKKRF